MPGAVISAAVIIGASLIGWALGRRKARDKSSSTNDSWEYETLTTLTAGMSLPAMFVDLAVLRANVRRYCAIAKAHGKTIRLATKSVRVPDIIQLILAEGEGVIRGLMCFSAVEAHYLATECELDDILLGYPIATEDLPHIWSLVVDFDKTVHLMVDCPAHIHAIDAFWLAQRERTGRGADKRVSLCIDIDCSYELLNGAVHLGPQRSPVRNRDALAAVVDTIIASSCCVLKGLMGYEAQISGVQDANPFDPAWLRTAIGVLQRASHRDVITKRAAACDLIASRGVELAFVNGGGSGSLAQTANEKVVTEVTAGSGFLQSHLFDYFSSNPNECAMAFALRVTRMPEPSIVTCQSGGFNASGKATADKAPLPFRPIGCRLSDDEGCGEVQTPVRLPPDCSLQIGDPVFFRPAKAGEIAERFDAYHLVEGQQVQKALTYRGLGHTFY